MFRTPTAANTASNAVVRVALVRAFDRDSVGFLPRGLGLDPPGDRDDIRQGLGRICPKTVARRPTASVMLAAASVH